MNYQKVAVALGKAVAGAALAAAALFFTKNPAVLGPYTAAVVLLVREVDNAFFGA